MALRLSGARTLLSGECVLVPREAPGALREPIPLNGEWEGFLITSLGAWLCLTCWS